MSRWVLEEAKEPFKTPCEGAGGFLQAKPVDYHVGRVSLLKPHSGSRSEDCDKPEGAYGVGEGCLGLGYVDREAVEIYSLFLLVTKR